MDVYEQFGAVLGHVLGEAFAAANYELEAAPMQQKRGLFRYTKALASTPPSRYAIIEFQTLFYPQSDLSRFRVNLIKRTLSSPIAETEYTLSELIWDVYEVQGVLPTAEHWWLYKHPQDLAQELYDVGKLLFGFGVPWLEDHPTEG